MIARVIPQPKHSTPKIVLIKQIERLAFNQPRGIKYTQGN